MEKQVIPIEMPGEDPGTEGLGTTTQVGKTTMRSVSNDELAKPEQTWEQRYKALQSHTQKEREELAKLRKAATASSGEKGIESIADKPQEKPGEISKIAPQSEPDAEPSDDVDSILAKAGLDKKDVASRLKDGKISDEDYVKLRKGNPWLSRAIANKLVESELKDETIKVLNSKMHYDKFSSAVGGEEGIKAFYEKARTLPEAQQKELDDLLQSGKIGPAVAYFSQLTGGIEAKPGKPALIQGRPGVPAKGPVNNLSDWSKLRTAAMRGDQEAIEQLKNIDPKKFIEWSKA